jgi:hypothetical protein
LVHYYPLFIYTLFNAIPFIIFILTIYYKIKSFSSSYKFLFFGFIVLFIIILAITLLFISLFSSGTILCEDPYSHWTPEEIKDHHDYMKEQFLSAYSQLEQKIHRVHAIRNNYIGHGFYLYITDANTNSAVVRLILVKASHVNQTNFNIVQTELVNLLQDINTSTLEHPYSIIKNTELKLNSMAGSSNYGPHLHCNTTSITEIFENVRSRNGGQ